jgi:hypothetical protein
MSLLGRPSCALDDDNSYRATVLCKIQDVEVEIHANIKFLVELADGEFDEIIAYGTLCECIEDLEDADISLEERYGPLRKSFEIKVPLKYPARIIRDPCTMYYCYGMMVLKLMNHSKWSLKMTQ